MKKVMILAYDFPPYVSVGGLRPYSWYKYFPKYGIYPIIVTRQWENRYGNELDYISPGRYKEAVIEQNENGTIIRAPYKANFSSTLLLKYGEKKFRFIRKLFSFYYECVQYFFLSGPKSTLYREARKHLKKNKVDLIIATGDPFVLFRYASRLSHEFNVPWVADYRDLWSHSIVSKRNPLTHFLDLYWEKKLINRASAITVVSEFLGTKLSAFKSQAPIYVVGNGYDAEAMDAAAKIPQGAKELTLAIIGTIYDWHPIDGFLKGVLTFIKNEPGARFKLKFYGVNFRTPIAEYIQANFPALTPYCEIISRMPNGEVLKKLASANVLVLFNNFSFYGTKMFDYVGLKRKILLCFTDDPQGEILREKYFDTDETGSPNTRIQEELIERTRAGIAVKKADDLTDILRSLYVEFNETGKIKCDTLDADEFSRDTKARELARLLENLYGK